MDNEIAGDGRREVKFIDKKTEKIPHGKCFTAKHPISKPVLFQAAARKGILQIDVQNDTHRELAITVGITNEGVIKVDLKEGLLVITPGGDRIRGV